MNFLKLVHKSFR